MTVKIEPGWQEALHDEFEKPYFADIKAFLVTEYQSAQTVYPPAGMIFNAFNLTPFKNVKVVLLGQDPYHGAGQAHGLCFSVPQGVKPPPSLVNIFKELRDDVGCTIPTNGDLTAWAQQGVLLLNAILTVRAGQPASHHKAGWEHFTNAVIQKVSDTLDHAIFILWGKFAQQKVEFIDASKHLVLMAAHPSPYSANNGFFGCKHFSKTNAYLTQHHIPTINWQIQ